MIEEWRDVSGYEGYYQVSNTGLIRSLDRIQVLVFKNGVTINRPIRGRVLRFFVLRGYQYARLGKDGVQRTVIVHRLVADAFLPVIEGKDQVNHIDFNGCNNRVDNLEWTTRSENQKHSVKHGRGIYGKPGWKIQSRIRKGLLRPVGDF